MIAGKTQWQKIEQISKWISVSYKMFTKGGEIDEKLLRRPNADKNVAGRNLMLGIKGERKKQKSCI